MNDSVEGGGFKGNLLCHIRISWLLNKWGSVCNHLVLCSGSWRFLLVHEQSSYTPSVLKCVFTFNQRNNSKRQSSMNFKEKLIRSIVLITDTFLLPSLYNNVTNRLYYHLPHCSEHSYILWWEVNEQCRILSCGWGVFLWHHSFQSWPLCSLYCVWVKDE